MEKILLLVAGMPGTGKTKLARYLSEYFNIPLICKDTFKEIMWERLRYDSSDRTKAQKYGALAYDISYHCCEEILKTGQSLTFESNFTNASQLIIQQMADKYNYSIITVLLDGNVEIIHKRFLERDKTTERHPGLISSAYYDNLDVFSEATRQCREFSCGHVIRVDTTDFAKVSYENIIDEIIKYTARM